jgi:small subunit ribosomal protein S1
MSEDITNVVDDEAEVAATPATDPTATATPADADAPSAEESTETADAVSEAAPAEVESAVGEESASSAEPVAEATPTEEVAEVVADWSPTQESAETADVVDETATEAPAEVAEVETATEEAEVSATTETTDAETETSTESPEEAEVSAATETTEAETETSTEVTAEAATPAAEGEASQERPRKRDRDKRGNRNANKRKLDTIEPGEEMQGVIRSLQTYGAFVDVGAERDGLVHISELRDGFVEKVEDVVKEGDTVSVRVKEVDVSKGRLSLTMRPPRPVREERAPREPRPATATASAGEGAEGGERPRRERREPRGEARGQREGGEQDNRIKLRDLVEGATLTGKVTSLVDYGAFIDIGAVTDGLVHISEIQDERVNKVSDVLAEGQEVQVRVLSVDKKRNRVSLSMKAESERVDTSYDYQEEDVGFEPASPMKDAFDRAREKKRRDKKGGDKRRNRYDDDEVDDIISRTLRWRD